jgi:hypothetical protein
MGIPSGQPGHVIHVWLDASRATSTLRFGSPDDRPGVLGSPDGPEVHHRQDIPLPRGVLAGVPFRRPPPDGGLGAWLVAA